MSPFCFSSSAAEWQRQTWDCTLFQTRPALPSRMLQDWALSFGWKQIILLSCPSCHAFCLYKAGRPAGSVLRSSSSLRRSNTIKHLRVDDRSNFFQATLVHRGWVGIFWNGPVHSWVCWLGVRWWDYLLFVRVNLVWCSRFIQKVVFTHVEAPTEPTTLAIFFRNSRKHTSF